MESVILKKENGVVTQSVRSKLVTEQSYLGHNEQCFLNIMPQCVSNCKKSDVDAVRKAIYVMVQEITKTGVASKVMSELYKRLKKAQTRSDLLQVVELLETGYGEIIESKNESKQRKPLSNSGEEKNGSDVRVTTKFYEQLRTNPGLVVSIATKKITSMYYFYSILALGKEKVAALESLKVSGASVETMLEYFGEKFDQISATNGIENLSKKVFVDTIDVVFDQLQTHLCWENCANASAIQCKKIADGVMKKISAYDFITDGYETFDLDGHVEHFIVTGCKNYSEVPQRVLTPADKARLRQASDALRMAYFGTGSVEEAYLLQAELEAKGEIMNIRGKRPSEKFIEQMKSKMKLKK